MPAIEKMKKNDVFLQKNGEFCQKSRILQDLVMPTYMPKTLYCEIKKCLPEFVVESLKLALPRLNQKLAGFADSHCLLTAVETRTSCPVQIVRNGCGQGNLDFIYPIGEGAGYAGGIMTSAVDGMLCAENIYNSI